VNYILEISVEAAERAAAAQRGGADRIELCSDLALGGLTPSSELMRAVRGLVRLPIFAMIRPRGGDFVYSNSEFEAMRQHIVLAKEFGMNGVVFGLLDQAGDVDLPRTRELVEFARPLPVTFHRAFDASNGLRKSMEDVIRTGASRILTSGGAPTALEGLVCLSELVEASRGRILIVPASGIHAVNVLRVAQGTGAREFHAGLSTVICGMEKDPDRFEQEVRKLAALLDPH
jgi:copper homeostasis protein